MTKYGLCCIHIGLQDQGFRFQTMTWKRFNELGRDKALKELAEKYANNLCTIYNCIRECGVQGWNYRVSSDIFPLMTHPEAKIDFDNLPTIDRINKLFELSSKEAYNSQVRLSCHPDQFNVLGSQSEKAVSQTIIELNHHAWFMDKLTDPRVAVGTQYPINIHINNSTGTPEDIAKRFKDNFDKLDKSAQKRLAVEVEDKGIWSAKKLVEFFRPINNIPVTFDYLHHKCNSDGVSEEHAFRDCAETWDTKPLFHYAESLPDQKNLRKHADYPIALPDTYGMDIDIDFEFKMKDKALAKAKELKKEVLV